MEFLVRHIKRTADIAAGYQVGNLVIDDGVFIQLETGQLIPATDTVEVNNGDHWQTLIAVDVLRKTHEGWPAYAGLTARMKKEVAHEAVTRF